MNASILLPNASVLATRSDFDTSTFPSEGPSKRHANYFGCEQEFVGPPIYATFLNATSSVRVATIRCALSSR